MLIMWEGSILNLQDHKEKWKKLFQERILAKPTKTTIMQKVQSHYLERRGFKQMRTSTKELPLILLKD
jgi:hypothetical protein